MRDLRGHHGARVVLAAAGVLALWLVVGGARAAEEEPAYSALAGSITYRTYCSNCHGAEGRGDGYLADALKRPPADLTTIAARNGGVFPAERVREFIDGREEVKTHGRREMPIWGDIFLWPEGESEERRQHVERKLGELVEHLRTIQEPAPTG